MPKSIRYFEWAWLGSLAIGFIVAALFIFPLIGKVILSAYIVPPLIMTVFKLILIFLISRKCNNIAKWILVVLFVISFAAYIISIISMTKIPGPGLLGVLSTVQVMMELIGVYFLFTEESRIWFRSKNKAGSI